MEYFEFVDHRPSWWKRLKEVEKRFIKECPPPTRSERMPMELAPDAISAVLGFYSAASAKAGISNRDATKHFMQQVYPVATQKDGDELWGLLNDWKLKWEKIDADEYGTRFVDELDQEMMLHAEIVLAYVGNTWRMQELGELHLAWTYAVDAQSGARNLKERFETNYGSVMPEVLHETALTAIAAMHSTNGKKGAQAKADKKQPIVEFVIQKWANGTWNNANHAAYHLQSEVKEMMTNAGVPFSESNLQKTIAGWINRYKKSV